MDTNYATWYLMRDMNLKQLQLPPLAPELLHAKQNKRWKSRKSSRTPTESLRCGEGRIQDWHVQKDLCFLPTGIGKEGAQGVSGTLSEERYCIDSGILKTKKQRRDFLQAYGKMRSLQFVPKSK
jgi:hypothetical protein